MGSQGQIQRSNFKQRQMAKQTVPTCWPWSNMQKCPWWPFHLTYGSGVKGQKTSNFKQCQMAKLTTPTCWLWSNMQKSPRWPLRPAYSSGVMGQKKVKYQTTSNGKTNGANTLAWSTKVKFQTTSISKTVGLGQTCQSLHSYLFVWPMIKGSKVINGQIFFKNQMILRCLHVGLRKTFKILHGDLFVRRSVMG